MTSVPFMTLSAQAREAEINGNNAPNRQDNQDMTERGSLATCSMKTDGLRVCWCAIQRP